MNLHPTRWLSRQHPLPPAHVQPTVEWQVCGVCNYNCSYCIQSARRRVGAPSSRALDGIIEALAGLPGRWEIKMSGGEPFAFSGFMEQIIPGLVHRTDHQISVLTNFSAPLDQLRRLCDLVGHRLRITSASFHPERADLDAFVAKALAYKELRRQRCPESSFVVNVVLVPGQLERHLTIRQRLQDAGLSYFPQLMKIAGGVYPYERRDQDLVERLTGGSHDPRRVNRAPSYKGLPCEAGRWYFVVDQQGEAYTCRTGKRHAGEGDEAHMGNLARGTLTLRDAGAPCPHTICPCTVPANRGMVSSQGGQRGTPRP